MVEKEAKQIKFVLDKAATLLKSYYSIMERIEQNQSEDPQAALERLQRVFDQLKAHNKKKDTVKMLFQEKLIEPYQRQIQDLQAANGSFEDQGARLR